MHIRGSITRRMHALSAGTTGRKRGHAVDFGANKKARAEAGAATGPSNDAATATACVPAQAGAEQVGQMQQGTVEYNVQQLPSSSLPTAAIEVRPGANQDFERTRQLLYSALGPRFRNAVLEALCYHHILVQVYDMTT